MATSFIRMTDKELTAKVVQRVGTEFYVMQWFLIKGLYPCVSKSQYCRVVGLNYKSFCS
ncbi:hypothetical protein [Candidatus Enterococcus clewellii]|uniref:Uncharacterized protein n=1 Tax=Candidatus Enterococcus clewellii TaxID=1834193 RepID=A0A242KC47_9ENTE|nr:hypothetical protein A5888_000557 [Enterococcus sp. 9E7_DIV0242]